MAEPRGGNRRRFLKGTAAGPRPAALAIQAMEAGKDIYLEKPMTLTIEEARDVYQASKRTGRVVQVGPQATSKGKYWAAAEAIKKGLIGKVVLSQSSYCRNSPEGE